MNLRVSASALKNRLRAVFLYAALLFGATLALSGCALLQNNPLAKTIGHFIPGGADVSARAAKIPYASLNFNVGGQGGLLVLAETTGSLTLWQSSRRESVVLRDGYLASTSGFPRGLELTDVEGKNANTPPPWRRVANKPVEYSLIRTWQNADGSVESGRARARLTCAAGTQSMALPLTSLALQRCREKLYWGNGATTSSVLWRDPKNHRIWAADTVPWPGAPRFHWQVARPWW